MLDKKFKRHFFKKISKINEIFNYHLPNYFKKITKLKSLVKYNVNSY